MAWSRPFFQFLLPLLVLGLILRFFFIQSLMVHTSRFDPHLLKGDLVLGSKISKPHRGDFVAFDCLSHGVCVGRILGKSGDRLDFEGDLVLINRTTQQELKLSDATRLEPGSFVVGPEHYFLEGDESGEVPEPQIRSVLKWVFVSVDPESRPWRPSRTLWSIH
ncbi:MAG TPA: signal peptidase I [Bdellovibrionales bacterium]|nr:signal peptidase I [Bdellovibrionales bacterium]